MESQDDQLQLLGDSESEYQFDKKTPRRLILSVRSRFQNNPALLAVLLLLLYIAVLSTIHTFKPFVPRRDDCHGMNCRDSLLPQSSIEYEVKAEWYPFEYPWNLGPSDELDNVWEDLLYALNIRVTPEEIQRLHKNTTNRIRVDGGDYLGVLGVYHHLHCLNNLRRLVHWEYYAPKIPGADTSKHGPLSIEHSDHCIDSIRQAVMCHANTELHTGVWVESPEELMSGIILGHTSTTCVRWDSVNDWARSRALRPGEFTYRPTPFDRSWEE
ncbi:hypothetical protein F4825DRAFT_455274 [Nemania diffusa]|nr:hypothetical protein F4825DRAFT_455274 [Nemania diffusa]